jgi:hypothetical protein
VNELAGRTGKDTGFTEWSFLRWGLAKATHPALPRGFGVEGSNCAWQTAVAG